MASADTPLTYYSISNVLKLRRLLATEPVMLSKLGARLSAEDFNDLAEACSRILPPGIPFDNLRDSWLHRVGVKFSKEHLAHDAWLFAGNIPSLRAGLVIRPWVEQVLPEWVPLQITDEKFVRTTKGKLGALYTTRVLAGSPAGLEFEFFLAKTFCAYLAPNLGFTKPYGKHPFHDTADFVNLRMYGLAIKNEQALTPRFEKFSVPASMVSYNKKLLAYRNRDAADCPHGVLTHCHLCPVGYADCTYATHPATYIKQKCHVCKTEAWTDPRRQELQICVRCDRLNRLSRK